MIIISPVNHGLDVCLGDVRFNVSCTCMQNIILFDLQIPGRVFNISAESEQEQNDWMVAIKQTLSVIHELNQAPVSTSVCAHAVLELTA